jgi:hypothetical protein
VHQGLQVQGQEAGGCQLVREQTHCHVKTVKHPASVMS